MYCHHTQSLLHHPLTRISHCNELLACHHATVHHAPSCILCITFVNLNATKHCGHLWAVRRHQSHIAISFRLVLDHNQALGPVEEKCAGNAGTSGQARFIAELHLGHTCTSLSLRHALRCVLLFCTTYCLNPAHGYPGRLPLCCTPNRTPSRWPQPIEVPAPPVPRVQLDTRVGTSKWWICNATTLDNLHV